MGWNAGKNGTLLMQLSSLSIRIETLAMATMGFLIKLLAMEPQGLLISTEIIIVH